RKSYEELILTSVVTFITAALIFIVAPYVSNVQTINPEQYSALFSSNLSLSLVITACFTYYILKTLEINEEKLLDETRFKDTVYDTSLDSVFIVDSQSMQITGCNKKAVEVFGLSDKEEITGMPVRQLLGEEM